MSGRGGGEEGGEEAGEEGREEEGGAGSCDTEKCITK